MKAYTHFAYVYDRLMTDVPYERWATYIDQTLKKYGKARGNLLEVGCGTGTLTGLLYDFGYPITGTDLSEDMLSEAQLKSIDAGQRIPFICQDMKELHFKPQFEAVISVCDGLNYLRENEDVALFLASAAKVLKSDGLLILEWSSPYKLEHVIGNRTISEVGEDVSFIWENHFVGETQTLEGLLHLFIACEGEDGLYEKQVEKHVQKAHSLEFVNRIMAENGFEVLEIVDSENWEMPVEQTERYMLIAKKRV